MKKIISICLSIFLLALLPAQLFAKGKHLSVLFFSDLHGYVEATEKGGGAARIATIVHNIEEENKSKGAETLVLFGGDAITGSLISYEYKGRAEFDFFNQLGLDAMVIGNHEFDNEISGLGKLIGVAKFPVIAANIYWKDSGERFAQPYVVLSKDYINIGVLGLLSADADVTTHPKFIKGLKFSDPVDEAKKDIAELRSKSGVVIALAHMGPREGKKLAKNVKGINLILGGHDHGALKGKACILFKKTPFCMTPANGRFVGRVDLKVSGKRVKYEDSELIPVSLDVGEDPEVSKIIAGYSKAIEKKYSRVIGVAREDLNQDCKKQCALGSFVADAIKWRTKADVALMNSGGLRAPIEKGAITLKNIYELAPFTNSLVLLRASGKDIVDIVNFGIRGGHSYPQFAGIQFDVEDNKICNVRIGGKALDPERQYLLATNDFLTSGDNGYSVLKKLSVVKILDKVMIRDALVGYVKYKKIIQF